MNKLVTYKVPKLALLEQKMKLREYSDEQKNKITHSLVGELLNLLGVSDGKIEHHKKLHQFINHMYGSYTYEEIDEAFKMYVAGRFKIRPFQQLNSVVFGQVISEYNIYKKESLKEYRNKKENLKTMSESEKKELILQGCGRLFSEYKKHKRIVGVYAHIYDYLFQQDLLPKDRLYKDLIFEKAKIVAIYEEKQKPKGRSISEIRNEVERIKAGKSKDKVVLIAKSLVLEEYFRGLVENNLDLIEEINR